MANLTDADKVLRNDVGKSIVSKLDDIADAIVQHGGGAESLGQLSDVNIDTTTLAAGQSIVYNDVTEKFENGQVSTVGGLNDLDDVTLTNVTNKQELVYDDNADVFKNKTTRIELTQAQYDLLVTPDPDVDYYITDAPSMTGTSQELSYDGGTDSVYDVVEEVKDAVNSMVYQVGEQINIGTTIYGGRISNSSRNITFTIPLNKIISSGITGATLAGNFTVYSSSSSVDIANDGTDGTWAVTLKDNCITFVLTLNTAISITNGTSISVMFTSGSGKYIEFT